MSEHTYPPRLFWLDPDEVRTPNGAARMLVDEEDGTTVLVLGPHKNERAQSLLAALKRQEG